MIIIIKIIIIIIIIVIIIIIIIIRRNSNNKKFWVWIIINRRRGIRDSLEIYRSKATFGGNIINKGKIKKWEYVELYYKKKTE